jgi:non-heme chloroperoxidase
MATQGEKPPREVRSVELTGRTRLEYVAQGDAAGIPVVLLHGITDSWRSFERVLPLLPPGLRVFALSQRGHGDSGRPEAGYHPDDFAEDVRRFLDALAIDSAIVTGHSMGSYVALRFAIRNPQRTRGLILAGAFPGTRGNPGIDEFWNVVSGLEDPIDRDFIAGFQRDTMAQPVPDDFFETVVEESRKVPARIWKAVLAGLMQSDSSGELGRVRAPTLLLWGERDSIFPRADQDALLAGISGAKLKVYPGVGHGLHWEAPERFAADLSAFALEHSR